MNFNLLKAAVILSVSFLFPNVALADVNKCTTKAGKIEYRDGPCEGTGTSVTVVKKRDNAGENTPSSNYSNNTSAPAPAPAPSAPRAEASAPAPAAPSSSVIQAERRPKYSKSPNNRPPDYLR